MGGALGDLDLVHYRPGEFLSVSSNHEFLVSRLRSCTTGDAGTCPECDSARLVRHDALHELTIAHLDCDAFYAAIEKRDRPELRDEPADRRGRPRSDPGRRISPGRSTQRRADRRARGSGAGQRTGTVRRGGYRQGARLRREAEAAGAVEGGVSRRVSVRRIAPAIAHERPSVTIEAVDFRNQGDWVIPNPPVSGDFGKKWAFRFVPRMLSWLCTCAA